MTQIESVLGPKAKIIQDSINLDGHRLTTMEVMMHRFVLAEFNTHRVLSRNSASSRAIPVKKTMDRVMAHPAIPVHWGSEIPGMQSGDSLTGNDLDTAHVLWGDAKRMMVMRANSLSDLGLHKSLCNRLLEPFMWHTAIVSATEWDNFFWQRCHPDAQPEIKEAADAMQLAYFSSTPKVMGHGEWHMPYLRAEDWEDARNYLLDDTKPMPSHLEILKLLKKVSVARCARVSYLTQDGHRSISADLDLFDRLELSGHWSPFEHVATPKRGEKVVTSHGATEVFYGCGNYIGWQQYRKLFSNENRTKFLPNLPELAQVRMRMEAGLTPWVDKGENV